MTTASPREPPTAIGASARPVKFPAIYLRTSTSKQDLASQESVCRAASGPDAVAYQDAAVSGKKDDRREIQALLEAARQRKISKVYVSELSRIGRSLGFTVRVVEELHALGVPVILAKTGTVLDPSTVEGKATLGALALAADIEHALLIERNERGRQRMREKGSRPGRKPKAVSAAALRALAGEGRSASAIAKELGVSKPTVLRRFRTLGIVFQKGHHRPQLGTASQPPNCETTRREERHD